MHYILCNIFNAIYSMYCIICLKCIFHHFLNTVYYLKKVVFVIFHAANNVDKLSPGISSAVLS